MTKRLYWIKRQAAKTKSELIKSRQKISQRQQYVCPVCGESLLNDDQLIRNRIEGKFGEGKRKYGLNSIKLIRLG